MFWELPEVSTWNNTCFLFKCTVTFRLRHFSKARFGTLALYILRLRCLVISNTYKNSSCFLSKTETFQKDVEYVPKMPFFGAALLFSLVVTKENCFENFLRSLYLEQYVFFVQMQSPVLAALVFERYVRYFGSLHPAFEMSCDIEYLLKQPLFLEQNRNFPKRRWVRSKFVFLSSGGLLALVVTKKAVLRTCSHLSTWNKTCFWFKCRVAFWLR